TSDMVCGYAYSLHGDLADSVNGNEHDHITLDHVSIDNPYNGIFIAQSSFDDLEYGDTTAVRGDYCVRNMGLDTRTGGSSSHETVNFQVTHVQASHFKCGTSYSDGLVWGGPNNPVGLTGSTFIGSSTVGFTTDPIAAGLKVGWPIWS